MQQSVTRSRWSEWIAHALRAGVLATGTWGALALLFGAPHGTSPHPLGSTGFAVFMLAAFAISFKRRWRWAALGGAAVAFAAVLIWWLGMVPSNDRDWNPSVAVLPSASVAGERVTVRNIRNFDYRSQTDFTPAYYDKRFDLAELQGIDLIAVYWMGPAIAHTFLSFDFGDGNRLAVSIETRTTKGDAYSTIKGLFRQYELFYVVADERDVIRLRTNYRHDPDEQVYIYRVRGTRANARRVFMEYIRQINDLHARPQFYNTLTSNCTTDIWRNAQVSSDRLPLSWKMLASGYVPEALYEAGRLDMSIPFAELQRRSHVNQRAMAADRAADFSERIR